MYKSLPETPDTQTRQRAARGRESVFFFKFLVPRLFQLAQIFLYIARKNLTFGNFPSSSQSCSDGKNRNQKVRQMCIVAFAGGGGTPYNALKRSSLRADAFWGK